MRNLSSHLQGREVSCDDMPRHINESQLLSLSALGLTCSYVCSFLVSFYACA